MLSITYSYLEEKLPKIQFQNYLNLLPKPHQDQVNRFRFWRDKHLCLFGKLLLLEGVKKYGYSHSILSNIEYTPFNKPYFNNTLKFNISHSGNMVICAMSNSYELGVDTEEIKPISKKDFSNLWTQKELEFIIEDENYNWFYKLWTRKEAVIKADGKGLNIPLKNLDVLADKVSLHNCIWHLNELSINNKYVVHIATDKEILTLPKAIETSFYTTSNFYL
ncbi:4'-phosphopantetheinyl transferase superfamily protein [uncultured Aquimarina sp.]|uniref:4'-phosphopantetheinyl transferase family protein n=1 Tax=uncultured Aquimarina sp. TaxID=575652 RepID=UPI002613CA97|nr:4'-phosphopantetheinyl transferase superfamily protein [uncultured Aquimarina sp.]